MTPENAKGMLDFLLPQMQQETVTTRKVLAAVPAENTDYKPSEKCMTGLELATHLAVSEAFFLRGVVNGGFEWTPQTFATSEEVVAFYDATIPGLLGELAAMPSEKLAQPISFATFNEPAVTYLSINLRHGIHHRGQLCAYLRPMGGKVPAIYGPSADEPIKAAQAT